MKSKLSFIICLVVLLVLIPIITLNSLEYFSIKTYSRYMGLKGGNSPIEVAIPIVTNTIEEITLPLDSMTPGQTKTYDFSIKNFNSMNEITETSMNYTIKIEDTNYLPIDYELQKETEISGTYENVIMNNGITSNFVLPHSLATSHNYRLLIIWDDSYDIFYYANLVEIVTITIDAEQKVD